MNDYQQGPNVESPFYTVGELAVYLRVCEATIYRMAKKGTIPGAQIGRSWRFHKDTIEKWIRENSQYQLQG
ncbi:MAG: helix-turn-helix domain-containing protein [Candidatus Aenigmarchaeota archaeon]|nr:helix-turn-helix domain-containing protein [Candidatus Aenigmarchaeota archaeon]